MTRHPAYEVARASRNDEAGVCALLTSFDLPTDGVHDALPDFFVARADNEIIGVGGLERCGDSSGGILRSIAVAESMRGTGLGKALVARVIDHARDAGVDELYLLTITAENYFPRFGFERIARSDVPQHIAQTVEFTDACPASAIVMKLSLTES